MGKLQKAPVCTRQVAKGAEPPYLQKAPESQLQKAPGPQLQKAPEPQLQKAPDSGARPPFAKGAGTGSCKRRRPGNFSSALSISR